MVSTLVEHFLQSYLGQYLELSDTSISVGYDIKLKNVKLKDSAFTDLGLPVKCVHGKVAKLVIKIPWVNLYSKPTIIELDGLHLLVVYTTSVQYDEEKEQQLQFEAKQKRLQKAEEAKIIQAEKNGEEADGFVQKLCANIIKNLEVTITNVHIRFEDKNSNGSPFAAGLTLSKLVMKTTKGQDHEKLTLFNKKLELDSFAIYWKPRANLYSTDTNLQEDVIDVMFHQTIATKERTSTKLKYLLGPISSMADLKWCPNPERFDYEKPIVDLSIQMEELSLQLTKYQYHDFVNLLQSLEFIQRASQFRKYKARHGLETATNYKKKYKQLWKFAFDCIYEEEVMRVINNWSWSHMEQHLHKCKVYQSLYKEKLSTKKPSEDLLSKLLDLEKNLDEFNITVQRQIAEKAVKEKKLEKENNPGFWGSWFSSSKNEKEDESQGLMQRLKEMNPDEKEELFKVIDYQENAHHGIYKKSYVAHKLQFNLGCLKINISDEDKRDATILKLNLEQVFSDVSQRPSADNIFFQMHMKKLTISGLKKSKNKNEPLIVMSKDQDGKLLAFSFENNPPHNPKGDLDSDKGSLYDQRIKMSSCPLEIIYDKYTVNALVSLFKTPDEVNLDTLQQQAFAKLKEYRESTALRLQYAIDNHNLIDVDISFQSSVIIAPHAGEYTENCACAILNLGSIVMKSKPITQEIRNVKDSLFKDLGNLKNRILDQVYDNFKLSMTNMQILLALPNENWRQELGKKRSNLYLLSPLNLEFIVQLCLVKDDPELPICKVQGHLDHISINISDYRLVKLAQIMDSIAEPEENLPLFQRSDSNDSMHSALSSLVGSANFNFNKRSVNQDVLQIPNEEKTSQHLTELTLDFSIDRVVFKMSQAMSHSNVDEEIFNFVLDDLKSEATKRTFDFSADFNLGGISCTHLLLKTPEGQPVQMLRTAKDESNKLLSVKYEDVKKNSPELVEKYSNILKNLDVNFAGVEIVIHQNAITDLINKINKFTDELKKNAKNLWDTDAETVRTPTPKKLEEVAVETPKKVQRTLSRRLSFKTSTNIARWSARAKLKSTGSKEKKKNPIDLKISSKLGSVTFHLMTSAINLAELKVETFQFAWIQTNESKVITARLVNFEIRDSTKSPSNYRKIAESMDTKVFDATICLYDRTPQEKMEKVELEDLSLDIKMGRIRFVFLMKFINDILEFIEPFSGAKEIVAEEAGKAFEEATKTVMDAYASQTRAILKVQMDAPLIIIPINSKSRMTFLADLGTLNLSNRFSREQGRVFDNMDFTLKELKLNRVKVDENVDCNQVVASCPLINPITFDLKIRRNMEGAKLRDDPAEIEVTGNLYKIEAEMSKGDYNVMMAILTENLNEKGEYSISKPKTKDTMDLPGLKTRNISGGSRTSIHSGGSFDKVMNDKARDPESKAVKFKFKFRGFQAEIFDGRTDLHPGANIHSPANSLAKIHIQVLGVEGHLNISGNLEATAFLQNLSLEDSRPHEMLENDQGRIVKLMESKDHRQKMIDILYSKDPKGNQDIEVIINSFILVGSVSYLMDIAYFFTPDESMLKEWKKDSLEDIPENINAESDDDMENKMNVFIKMEEPDIFLVENISDLDTDALMLNTELQFKFWSVPKDKSMAMMASLSNIRCHTCRFNPARREETMAQILQPCTLCFSYSDNEGHGTERLQCNISDLCLNVAPRSIQIISNSVQAFFNDHQEHSETAITDTEEDFSSLWFPKDFEASKFWFLRDSEVPVAGQDALDTLSSTGTIQSHLRKDQQAILQINNIVIKFESGLGNNTIPLLLLESKFSCNVKDWSSKRLTMIGSFDMEMAYYNAKLALWEPVIEPTTNLNGTRKRWDMNVTLQQNASSDLGSALVSPSFDVTDGIVVNEHMPPLMILSLQSTETLEITVTKTFLSVVSSLAASFKEITSSSPRDSTAPIVVKNSIGKNVTVHLDYRDFKYFKVNEKPGDSSHLDLEHDREVQLNIYRDRSKDANESTYISPLQEQSEQAEAYLKLKVKGEKGYFEIPVCKADKRFFPFQFRGDERGDLHGMVSEILVENGTKYINLKSIIDIKNHYIKPVNVFRFDGRKRFFKIGEIQPDKTFNVPLEGVYSDPSEFFFQVHGEGETMSYEAYNWRDLIDQAQYSKQIHCTNTRGGPDIYINIEGTKEEIFWEKTGKLSGIQYILDIRPLVVLKNCLPVTLFYATGGQALDQELPMLSLEPGESGHLQGIRVGYTSLHLKIFEFRQTDWSCSQLIEKELNELSTWRFYSKNSELKMDLDINSVISHGTHVLSIYAPFWMINKTGKDLTYRGQDPQNVIYHQDTLNQVPMMFSFTKRFMGKRKASICIQESQWSDPFTLDTIEDADKVTCKSKNQVFHIGVNINMSKSSLTKIITFTPYYLVYNTTQNVICVFEADALDIDENLIEIGPGQMLPFWPNQGGKKLAARIKGEKDITAPFSLHSVQSSLLLLRNRFGGLHVDVRISASETLVTLSSYKRGLAPVQLINNTREQVIHYGEKNVPDRLLLMPGQSSYYTWVNPQGDRTLIWTKDGTKSHHENTLQTDGEGVIELAHNKYLAWVSFLDGMQRVLLFTDDPGLCYSLAHTTGENERIQWEFDASIFGIGVSLVNNSCLESNYEVVYMNISSSDIVWEIRRKGKSRYKSLTRSQCDAIERDFQLYQREKSIGRNPGTNRFIQTESGRTPLEVDYEVMKMFSPHDGSIRRQFQKGLWLQLRMSEHQRQIHAKINRIQIDNQLVNCLFPVVLAPVPPPKSVLADSIPKPFMELSMLQYISEHTKMAQYKYVCALVQEVHLKIDQGLLNALMDMFEAEEEILDEDINEFLKEDLSFARRALDELATLRVTQGQKDFFDYLHLSPLKVHVSFSLASYQSQGGKIGKNRRSNFFSLFLQSLGVTITDTDDIIFRLAYFERKHHFYSTNDLFNEMIRHYTSQAIKQAYVIILGLDVIGNPFGLVVGVTRSVEDLFYEPFQGAVEGPSEFAEGVVIGVRSVFSGVVGGAAGTVSRITGALGKGIASLTFDEKFQNKRREAIKKRGKQNFGESMARSSKGLAVGIFEGVTGVATKPIQGAREDGVGGFFKGVGKGVVGLVARPTGGIIDFASGTFDSVKRVAETQEEINRQRPPRFLHSDGVVRNYNLKEATGWKYLRSLEKGKYADSDTYVTHEVSPLDNCAVLLVSNKRILFMSYQSVLGNWSLDWEYSFPEITGPPAVGRDDEGRWYIILEPKEKKKSSFFFGSGDNGKKVYICSRENARQLANTIEEIRTTSQN